MWRSIVSSNTVALLLLFSQTAAFATSLIAIRTPNWVVVGVDSKATYRGTPGPPVICKIYNSGTLYFVIVGLEHDSARNFYPKNIVAESFSSVNDFASAVTKVETALKETLLADLNALRREDPETFNQTVRTPTVMTVLMIQFRDGEPYAASSSFLYTDSNERPITVQRRSCPGDCPNGVYAFYSEKTEGGKQYLATHRDVSNPVPIVKEFVGIEANESPRDVGLPIVVLALDKSGPKWVANDVGCPVVLGGTR